MFHQIFEAVLAFFGGLDTTSIFFLMALESSLFPVPSEAVMIPAGYLAATGKISLIGALFAGTLWSMFGASCNYLLGKYVGKPFLLKYGKYLLINHAKYLEAEALFQSNNRLYTFLGRFIPVIRHLISLPAGIFRMNYPVFVLITGLGSALWCGVLLAAGYYFGESTVALFATYTKEVSIVVVIGIVVFLVYFLRKKK